MNVEDIRKQFKNLINLVGTYCSLSQIKILNLKSSSWTVREKVPKTCMKLDKVAQNFR